MQLRKSAIIYLIWILGPHPSDPGSNPGGGSNCGMGGVRIDGSSDGVGEGELHSAEDASVAT